MSKIIIFGTGSAARLAHYYFQQDSQHEVVAFTIDAHYIKDTTFQGLPIIPFEKVSEAYPPSEFKMFVAVGYSKMNSVRATKYHAAKELGYTLVSYISRKCTNLSDNLPGDNCFILENNTIQPFVKIGNNVTLWSGNHIGHDSVIKDHCFLTSHVVVSGNVTVEPFCFLGVNSTVVNAIHIAARTLIGAGAIISKDTEEDAVYVPKRAEIFHKKSSEINL